MNEEREKIVNKLVKLGVFVTREHAYVVADFIIADRARIVKPYVEALYSLTDDDECSLDHHGYCQTHFSGSSPCLNKTALDLIKLSGVKI